MRKDTTKIIILIIKQLNFSKNRLSGILYRLSAQIQL
jgi:hypothetical protein